MEGWQAKPDGVVFTLAYTHKKASHISMGGIMPKNKNIYFYNFIIYN